ncbi:MAG: hypothetical protein LQ346_003510 [Caloplaca aetnensis]|nr:MAG: hypothetical protein LQ346_003510 [Caloplaca aetnensis]
MDYDPHRPLLKAKTPAQEKTPNPLTSEADQADQASRLPADQDIAEPSVPAQESPQIPPIHSADRESSASVPPQLEAQPAKELIQEEQAIPEITDLLFSRGSLPSPATLLKDRLHNDKRLTSYMMPMLRQAWSEDPNTDFSIDDIVDFVRYYDNSDDIDTIHSFI